MKLKHIDIKDFRGIRHFEHDFTDDFGRTRDVMLIVGPNSSGKTTILDAIWFGLMGELNYHMQREGFRTEPDFVVRREAAYTQVDYTFEITEAERQTLLGLGRLLRQQGEIDEKAEFFIRYPYADDLKHTTSQLSWTYPAQADYIPPYHHSAGKWGGYRYENRFKITFGRTLYKEIERFLPKNIISEFDGIEKIGRVYFFEQERDIRANPVTMVSPDSANDAPTNPDQPLDIRVILINLGIKDKVGGFDAQDSWYQRIQDGFNYICAPNRMHDVYARSSNGEYDIEFTDERQHKYGFDGLSSGERSVLNFLVNYVYKRMFNSIVLIDELEMHLHPTWQRRLLQQLQRFNDGNQFIITTHSPALMQIVPDDSVIELGDLDAPDWQYNVPTLSETE